MRLVISPVATLHGVASVPEGVETRAVHAFYQKLSIVSKKLIRG